MDFTERTALLIGKKGVDILKNSHVAVFGVGGVGGAAVEALVRAGIGKLTIVDRDEISVSNINRQVVALHSTVGQKKVFAMQKRIQDISPTAQIFAYPEFFLPDNQNFIDFSAFDYVVDAVDTITAKLLIIECAKAANVPVISAMGAGNRISAADFRVGYVEKTEGCSLARVMRRELRRRKIEKVKCVYSPSPVFNFSKNAQNSKSFKIQTGSISFVPPVMGYLLVEEVVKDLLKNGAK